MPTRRGPNDKLFPSSNRDSHEPVEEAQILSIEDEVEEKEVLDLTDPKPQPEEAQAE